MSTIGNVTLNFQSGRNGYIFDKDTFSKERDLFCFGMV